MLKSDQAKELVSTPFLSMKIVSTLIANFHVISESMTVTPCSPNTSAHLRISANSFNKGHFSCLEKKVYEISPA